MDDTQRIVKCGNLTLHSPSGFFKRWHRRYLVLYDGSKSGIKRLELFESEIKFKKQQPAKIIPLVDCVRVVTCQRNRTTYTFEVRTSDQFYLLAGHSFQDMNDWVNCLRLVAFGQQPSIVSNQQTNQPQKQPSHRQTKTDVLLDRATNPMAIEQSHQLTASQAAAAAASALAKTRQRQPSLLGACKPQPPTDSPFIRQQEDAPIDELTKAQANKLPIGLLDTMTPAVRGRLITAPTTQQRPSPATLRDCALDEEEENMLYCSIEANPKEHNYRVKVIETELSLRCQLKCYQLSAPITVSQQYESLGQVHQSAGAPKIGLNDPSRVTFYQLIVGPQELTLLNDYATNLNISQSLQQGLWSWPYQCIRRYGFDRDNCFIFEAGRKCTSGPGQFVVQTPKAYNIYNDVVHFVSELRSLSSSDLANQPNAKGIGSDSHAPGKASITQIPVSWTPASDNLNVTLQSSEPQPPTEPQSHCQFFHALRQLEPKDNNQLLSSMNLDNSKLQTPTDDSLKAPLPASSNPSPVSSMDMASGSTVDAKLAADCEPNATSEETDESGYEQGDDSVDISAEGVANSVNPHPRSRVKGLATTRKRQVHELSISSASSTSSRDGGSLGHSVGRRAANQQAETNHQSGNNPPAGQGPAKRPTLETSRQTRPAEQQLGTRLPVGGVRELIESGALGQPDEFEANLIRDVYSEISKLHATFAVASGSTSDESMSQSSCDQESDDPNSSYRRPPLSDEPSDDESPAGQPPMYSNLRLPRARATQPPSNPSSLARNCHTPLEMQRRPCAPQLPLRCPNPIFPTVLNPIPEIGDETPVCATPLGSKTPESRNAGQQPTRMRTAISYPTGKPLSQKVSQSQMAQLPRAKDHQSDVRSMSHEVNKRIATNHYVINDVQYAKISRNVCSSKYESCL